MDKIPINWGLIKNPINWVTIGLMLYIPAVAFDLYHHSKKPARIEKD